MLKSIRKWTFRVAAVALGVLAYKTKPWWLGEKLDPSARLVHEMATRQIEGEQRVGFDRAQYLEDQQP